MRKPNGLLAAVVAASFLVSSCMSVQRMPLPEPDGRSQLDLRGVVLGEGPNSRSFEFSEVLDTRWTETSLVLTGVVDAPGEPDHGQPTTVTFPLADISEVLVSELDGTRASIIVGGVIMGASIIIAFLVTGKSQDGVPVGTFK